MPLEYIPVSLTKQKVFRGESQMKIHFLDVGQGDCIIMEFPDNTKMIIDGGDNKTAVWQHILKYSQQIGIKGFDYMLLTHSDSDHVGGMSRVLDYYEVKNIYMPQIEDDYVPRVSGIYSKFVEAAKSEQFTDDNGNKQSAQIYHTIAGHMITTTDENNDFFLAVLSPFLHRYDKLNGSLSANKATAAEKNDVSAVLYIEYLGKKVLFTGDANKAVEDEVLEKYNGGIYNQTLDGDLTFFNYGGRNYEIEPENIDIFKAGHHGSEGSNSKDFIDLLRPKYTVVSAGEKNSYGHPHKKALDNFESVGSIVYQTAIGGDIVAVISPQGGGVIFDFSKKEIYVFAPDSSVCIRREYVAANNEVTV